MAQRKSFIDSRWILLVSVVLECFIWCSEMYWSAYPIFFFHIAMPICHWEIICMSNKYHYSHKIHQQYSHSVTPTYQQQKCPPKCNLRQKRTTGEQTMRTHTWRRTSSSCAGRMFMHRYIYLYTHLKTVEPISCRNAVNGVNIHAALWMEKYATTSTSVHAAQAANDVLSILN